MNNPIPKEISDSLRIPVFSPETVDIVAIAVIHHISATLEMKLKKSNLGASCVGFKFEIYMLNKWEIVLPAMKYYLRQTGHSKQQGRLQPVLPLDPSLCKPRRELQ